MASYARRKATDAAVRAACALSAVLAVLPLLSVLAYVARRGLAGLSVSFFTELPRPIGEAGGGMANALVGSLLLVGLACLFGIPAGVMAGIYLSEFGGGRLGRLARFSADVLAGVPSIIAGKARAALMRPRADGARPAPLAGRGDYDGTASLPRRVRRPRAMATSSTGLSSGQPGAEGAQRASPRGLTTALRRPTRATTSWQGAEGRRRHPARGECSLSPLPRDLAGCAAGARRDLESRQELCFLASPCAVFSPPGWFCWSPPVPLRPSRPRVQLRPSPSTLAQR